MKTLKPVIIWSIIVFVALTLFTMKNEAKSDGINAYGFPITFFDHFGGKCDNCYSNFGFKPLYLVTDIAVAFILSSFITILLQKIITTKKK